MAVVTYVNQSPMTAAKNIAIEVDQPIFLAPFHINHAANGPTIPIEKSFAPNVVIPPCARSKAWNTSTMAANTLTAAGPNNTAPKPVPVGWELLPVTEGIFNEDKTVSYTHLTLPTKRIV